MTLLVIAICAGLAYFIYNRAKNSGNDDGTGTGNNPPNGELPPTNEQ